MKAPGRPPPAGAERRAPDPGDRKAVYLYAGQVVVAASPTVISTVLGSCVAVCLFDPEAGVGGMNHFLLPYHVERERSPRFGTVAVPALVAKMVEGGARRSAIRGKVFGGSNVIGAFRRGNLGEENATLALRLLEDAGIPVVDRDLGGRAGRKLLFHTDDGTAWVRSL